MNRAAVAAGVVALLACASPARAFVTIGKRFVNGEFDFQADIVHPTTGANSMSGMPWNGAFANAAESWNAGSNGLVSIGVNTGVFEDPCGAENGIHGVDFTATVCGMAFGGSTLAVATKTSGGGGLILHANILFDQSKNFDIFTGPFTDSRRDFTRVAVHEIGHVLGLDHETSNPAIMEPVTSSIEVPQPDDLDGIAAIYDLSCPKFSSSSGAPIHGEIDASDCFDTEIGLPLPTVVFSTEANAGVDLYRITADGSQLDFSLTGFFNPVLMLVDDSLMTEIESDFDGATTNFSITPPEGDYVLVVRGIFEGEGGAYMLTGVPEPGPTPLGVVSLAALAGLVAARNRRRCGPKWWARRGR